MSYDRETFGSGIILNNFIVPSLSSQWNRIGCFDDTNSIGGKRCVNDKDYYIPYKIGDVLEFQFQNPVFCANGLVSNGADGSCDIDTISGGQGFKVNVRRCCDESLLNSYDLDSSNIDYTFSGYSYKKYPFSDESIYCYQNVRIKDLNVCGCCHYTYILATKVQPATGFFVFVNNILIGQTDTGAFVAGYIINYYVAGTNKNPIYITEVTIPDCVAVDSIYIEDIDTTEIFNTIISIEQDCGNQPIPVVGQCFYLEFIADGLTIGYSQQYKCLDCNENSVFIDGIYSLFDCDGTYYGLPSSEEFCGNYPVPIKHKNNVRVYGTLTRIEDQIERSITDSGCVSISSKVKKRYKLSTSLMPAFMMSKLSAILAAKTITLGLGSFQFGEYILREQPIFKPSGIKGNTMFGLEAIFELCECETEFNC